MYSKCELLHCKSALLSVLCLVTGLSGCTAFREYQEEQRNILKNDTIANMQEVIPHLKPMHFTECRKLLEQKRPFLGGSFRVVADFTRSNRHSCAARHRPMFSSKIYPTVAYVTMLQQYNTKNEPVKLPKQGACGFRLKSGKIDIFVSRTGGTQHDPCHFI